MYDFLANLANELEPTLADKALTLLLGLLGLALTYLATRLTVWAGKGGFQLTKVTFSGIYSWWKPDPCPVAVEILRIIDEQNAITDGYDLITNTLSFIDVKVGLESVLNEKDEDLLIMLPRCDVKRISKKAKTRYYQVARLEDKAEQERVAGDLRKNFL